MPHVRPLRAARATPLRAYPWALDPKRDMDERLNIEGDPADVLRALFAIKPCDLPDSESDPQTADEAIQRLIDG